MTLEGRTIGRYRVESIAGTGGMGAVYRARDIRLQRPVAIKVLPPALATDEESRRRFETEALSVAALNHPNIVTIHSVEQEDDLHFLVMELVEGRPLSDLIPADGFPLDRLLSIAIPLVDAIAAAHARGITHRDIKPANVMVTDAGLVKVLDFGLAKHQPSGVDASELSTREATVAGRIMGTVAYMSPEQAEGRPVDTRSDLFSIGTVLYEMATGRRPFTGSSNLAVLSSILKDTPVAVTSVNPTLPSELQQVVTQCLEKDPDRRIQSAPELKRRLESLRGASTASTATGSPPHESLARGIGRRRALVAGAALIVAALVGTLLLRVPWRAVPEDSTAAPTLEPTRVAVAPFENRTGDESLDSIGLMSADRITQGLSEIAAVDPVPSSSVAPAAERFPTDPADAHALGAAADAGTVVSGAYYLQGDTLEFQATVIDARDATVLVAIEPTRGPRADPNQALDQLRGRVLAGVAVQFDPFLKDAPMSPPRYAAYREWADGNEVWGVDFPAALRHFERAGELDPDFFYPRFLTFMALYQMQNPEALVRLERLNEDRERYNGFERLWIDWARATVPHRYAEALQVLREMEQLAPGNLTVNYEVGRAAYFLNRPGETVEAYRSLEFPHWVSPALSTWRLYFLTGAYHMLGRYEQELEASEDARAALPDLGGVRTGQVRALAALDRLADLNRVVDEALSQRTATESPGDLMATAVAELRAHGHPDAALELARRAVD